MSGSISWKSGEGQGPLKNSFLPKPGEGSCVLLPYSLQEVPQGFPSSGPPYLTHLPALFISDRVIVQENFNFWRFMWGFQQLFWGNRASCLRSSQLVHVIWEIKAGKLHLRSRITGGSFSVPLITLWPCLVLSTHTSEGTLLMNLASRCLWKVGRCLTLSYRWGRHRPTTWLFPKMLSNVIAVEISGYFIGQLPVDIEVNCNPGTCSLAELGYGLRFSDS